MPTPKKATTPTRKRRAAPANKAKAAFTDYKQRMDAEFDKYTSRASEAAAAADVPGLPMAQPYPEMMPAFILPQALGQVAASDVRCSASSGEPDGRANNREGSLFRRLENLLSLGVDVATVGLQGGLELMGGYSTGSGESCYQDHSSCCCGEYCCCEKNCCCNSCCDDCCCNPGVHNCH